MEDKKLNAGRVGLTMKGAWNASQSYEKLNCVSHNGRSWAAKKNVSAGVEPSAANSEFWQMMSDRGEQGIQGPVGPQGNSAYVKDGVVNKFELVNNLTQGGETAALSAEQGKILKTELTELESKTSGFPFIGYIDKEGATPKSYVKWEGQDCFFVATQGGTYKEFGNVQVLDGELAFIIYYNGTWIKQTIVPTTNKGFQFVGIVNDFTTKPATQFPLWDKNNNNFVLATEPGTYEHCGGLTCEEGEIAVFVTLNGTWYKLNSKIAKRGQSSEDARFIGKKISILGDSISTYQGYIPSNYQYFYPTSSCPDVDSVSKTYWKIVADNLGLSVKNCAYSGSTCAETGGYGVVGCSDERIAELGKDGNPDIVWVYIGINDWGYGKVDLGDWTPEKALPTNGDTFSNAYALMLSKIQIAYPDAKIFCSPLLPDKARDADHNYPLVNSRGISLKAFNDKIVEIANGLGVNVVNMPGCGINWNTMQYYFGDYSETYGIHPNAAGHKKMAAQLLAALKAMY